MRPSEHAFPLIDRTSCPISPRNTLVPAITLASCLQWACTGKAAAATIDAHRDPVALARRDTSNPTPAATPGEASALQAPAQRAGETTDSSTPSTLQAGG
ncbi:hypothetical protein AA0119_g4355 [Alternaria tenuissima]|uniref:Lipoprotein n=1 Tax=Alternaria tenuissima TaxID=119927 RepID=A0ABY0GHP1_9PLEO|nr:hypothetical protein AA0119_g4355 [Alternaria tenuissima]